jgi:hypothetical protein
MAPYFYAGEGELPWINESLACATTTREILELRTTEGRLTAAPPVWTTLAVSANWLANPTARDQLLASVTGQHTDVLYLLVHTTQPSFGTLGDLAVLKGFADVIEVMREAGVPVVVGRRGSCGLLLLALGAAGWSVGEEAKLQNMAPHPQAKETGGQGQPRLYLPELLNSVTPATFAVFNDHRTQPFTLGTGPGDRLIAANPTLDAITTEQRIWLHQHNLMAMGAQAADLAALAAGERVTRMRASIAAAREAYSALPDPPKVSDGGGFLQGWSEML